MEYEGPSSLALSGDSDERDLFYLTSQKLGRFEDEYDAEQRCVVKRFRRDKDCARALVEIRRLLRKYSSDERLRMQACLHKWGVVRERLLPLLQHSLSDAKFLNDLGRVFVFATQQPVARSRFRSAQVDALRDMRAACLRCGEFVPALLSLLTPILLPPADSNAGADSSVQNARNADVVLTIFKQMLEIPRPTMSGTTGAAIGSSAAVAAASEGDEFVLQLAELQVIAVAGDLARLLERRELHGLTHLLLMFWFELLKHVDGSTLFHMHRRGAARARVAPSALHAPVAPATHAHANPKGAAKDASRPSVSAALETASRPAAPSSAPGQGAMTTPPVAQAAAAAAAAAARRAAARSDPLAMSRNAVQAQRGAGIGRHSRFGTMLVSTGYGVQKVLNSVAAPTVRDNAPRAVRRGGCGRRKAAGAGEGEEEEDEDGVLQVKRTDVTDIFGGGFGLYGSDVDDAHSESRERVIRALFPLLQSFLAALKPDQSGAKKPLSAAGAKGTDDKADEGGDEDDAEEIEGVSGFAQLAAAVKRKFIRDEMDAEDRLRYFHVATVAMSTHRLASLAAINDAKSAAKKIAEQATSAPAVLAAAPPPPHSHSAISFNAFPVLECLDRWSFTNVLACLDDYTTRKQWGPVAVAAAHVRELVLTVHTMLEFGDDASKEVGSELYDKVFREREVSEAVPKLLRLYDPARFAVGYAAGLVEASHYLLKMAERAAAEGLRLQARSQKRAKKSGAEGNESDAQSEGAGSSARAGAGASGVAVRVGSGRGSSRERLFEVDSFTTEFCYPAVVQACLALLAPDQCLRNSAQTNYFATHLLRRIAQLPNDMAGKDPRTGELFTFRTMLYNVASVRVASEALQSARVVASESCRCVVSWAREFAVDFVSATRENPLLVAEALFWRGEKGVNAELARHYGIATHEASLSDSRGLAAGGKKKSKAAIAADEAEAEARKNRIAAGLEGGVAAATSGAGDDDEAQMSFSDSGSGGGGKRARAGTSESDSASDSDSDEGFGRQRRSGKKGPAGGAGKRRRLQQQKHVGKAATRLRKSGAAESGSGSGSSSGSSSGSDTDGSSTSSGSSGANSSIGGRPIAAEQRRFTAQTAIGAGRARDKASPRLGVAAESDDEAEGFEVAASRAFDVAAELPRLPEHRPAAAAAKAAARVIDDEDEDDEGDEDDNRGALSFAAVVLGPPRA